MNHQQILHQALNKLSELWLQAATQQALQIAKLPRKSVWWTNPTHFGKPFRKGGAA